MFPPLLYQEERTVSIPEAIAPAAPTDGVPPDPLLTLPQAGRLVGKSQMTMYRWLANGDLNGIAIKLGRRWYVRRHALEELLRGAAS